MKLMCWNCSPGRPMTTLPFFFCFCCKHNIVLMPERFNLLGFGHWHKWPATMYYNWLWMVNGQIHPHYQSVSIMRKLLRSLIAKTVTWHCISTTFCIQSHGHSPDTLFLPPFNVQSHDHPLDTVFLPHYTDLSHDYHLTLSSHMTTHLTLGFYHISMFIHFHFHLLKSFL